MSPDVHALSEQYLAARRAAQQPVGGYDGRKAKPKNARPLVYTLPKGVQSRARAARTGGHAVCHLAAALHQLRGEGVTIHGQGAATIRNDDR